MQSIITLEAIKRYKGHESVDLPENTIVTTEARAWAERQGITVTVGGRRLAPVTGYNGDENPNRYVISVIGPDRVGIIARVSGILAQYNVNILDINQTSLEGLFAMIMIADAAKATAPFETVKQALNAAGAQIGVRIDAQHEDVFRFMHRI